MLGRHYAYSAGESTKDFGDARVQVTERVDDASFELCEIRTKVVVAGISPHEGKGHVREGKIISLSVGAKILWVVAIIQMSALVSHHVLIAEI